MADELLLGLDVGTTRLKAAVFDLGRPDTPIAVSHAGFPSYAPRPGWSEAEPSTVLHAALATIADVVGEVGGRPIAALGIGGIACGAWLSDVQGAPLRSAILWNDGRAVEIVARWKERGTLDRIFEISGNVPYPGYTLPVLRWLADNEPELVGRARGALHCKDWLRLQLTGEWLSEESDASYVPFDIRRRVWSDELFALCEVEEEAQLLAPLAPTDHVTQLAPAIAERVGLASSTRVALGACDIVAGVVGAGAIAQGRAVTLLGTSANSSVVTAEPVFEPHGIGIMAASPLHRWVRTMVNTSGSMTLDWIAGLLTGGDVGAVLRLAERADPGAGGVVLIPYLSNAGVVTPFVDAAARGAIAGLRIDHRPEDIARAAVEGIAFAVADGYDCLRGRVSEITAVGGAARSDLLLQTIADATGFPVSRPSGDELGARGVALLAAWAAGLLAGPEELERVVADVEVARRFEPEPERIAESRARYRAAAEATRELWERW